AEHEAELAELERQKKEAEEKAEAEKAAKLAEKQEKAQAKAAKSKATGTKAKTAAAKKPRTFDLTGVGKYMTNDFQLETFRKIVERESVRKYLPIDRQAELAKAIVDRAAELKTEVSAYFIEDVVAEMLAKVMGEADKAHKEAVEEMSREDVGLKWMKTSHD